MSNIKNLVFSGGGIKIFIFAGCLKYLYENNLINSLEAVCGTSTGSIISTALALGYKLSEIIELLIKIDYSNFTNINSEGILNFYDNYGLDNTDELERVFRIIIKAKAGDENITFKELYNITNVKLVICATNINKMECQFFDHIKTPDCKVIDALISSISIPFMFCPRKIDDYYYVDGALTNNFPMEYFDKEIENTLGFININSSFQNMEINSIEQYFFAVSLCSITKLIKNTLDKYNDKSVIIDSNQNIIEFDLSLDKKYELINYGFQLTEDYFKKKKENEEMFENKFSDKETQTEVVLEELEKNDNEEDKTNSDNKNDN